MMRDITTKYYEVLRKAIDTGELSFEQIPFDEKISVIGPNERFDGIESVRKMYPFFIQLLKDFKIRQSFFSENSACFIIEFFPINNAPAILTAEWFQFNKGKISTITPIYDTAAWASVMAG